MARKKRPSLMGGLLWTGLGLLFLLRNFGIVSDLWNIVSRYWPVLLILLGLGKVIDYFRKKEGVSLRIGEVFGIICLLLIGSLVTKIANSRFRDVIRNIPVIDFGDEKLVVGDWLGNSYSFTEETSYPLSTPIPLRIENSYGGVIVSPGADAEIRVRLQKKIFADEEVRAKSIADEIELQGGTDSGVFVVKTNRSDLAAREYRYRTEMEVSVPRKSQLQVRNAYGEIRVSNIDGKLDLTTSHKELEVRDCSGEVSASNRYADSRFLNLTANLRVEARGKVYAEQIKGEVTIRNEYSPLEIKSVDGIVNVANTEGSITLEQISKPVIIDARGSQVTVSKLADSLKMTASHRRVRISDVNSNVSLDSRYSTVSLKDIKGNIELNSDSDRITADDLNGALTLKAQGSSLRVNTVTGPVNVTTSRKDIIVNDFSDSCSIVNEYGDVTLSNASGLNRDVSVKNRNGRIDLFLPENASFQLDATARSGQARSDFQGLTAGEMSGESGTLKGKVNSGGPRIHLETEYGNIRVRIRDRDSDRGGSRRSSAGD